MPIVASTFKAAEVIAVMSISTIEILTHVTKLIDLLGAAMQMLNAKY